MRFTTLEIQTLSTDSIHTLYGKIYIPIGTPKGIVQIIHGMSEHMELYDEFMSELAKNGYVSVVYDQLGHGKTAGGKDDLGFFAEEQLVQRPAEPRENRGKGSEDLHQEIERFANAHAVAFARDLGVVFRQHLRHQKHDHRRYNS